MIVVTLLAVVCGYVGWQARIVRERKTTLDNFSRRKIAVFYVSEDDVLQSSLPWIRRQLGDRLVTWIGLDRNSPKEFREHAREIFPESTLLPFVFEGDNASYKTCWLAEPD